MCKKIALGLVVLLVVFLAFVSTREGKFVYERSGVINASADKIFPYLTHFSKGHLWSPYEKADPSMKTTFGGVDGQVGSTMDFEAKDSSGRLEIMQIAPLQMVEVKLNMIKPFAAENLVRYTLSPDVGGGSRFSWSMSGDGGFMGKLMNVFIDCEKMVADDFSKGIANLKAVVESQP